MSSIPRFATAGEYERVRDSRCCLKDLTGFDDSGEIYVDQQTRRKTTRVPVSCTVHLRQIDLNELAGKMYNSSIGGFGLRTNYPISIAERLTVTFQLPKTIGLVSGLGRVVWRQFHGDTPGHEKTLFTAGIEFLSLSKPSRKAVRDCVRMSVSKPSEEV